MATLRPFRDYDEKDVVNLFGLHDTSLDSTQNLLTWATRLPLVHWQHSRPVGKLTKNQQ